MSEIESKNDVEKFSKIFKILGNSTRLCLLQTVCKKGKVGVRELASCTCKAQSYVSQELAKLKKWKVVDCISVGKQKLYFLIDKNICDVLKKFN